MSKLLTLLEEYEINPFTMMIRPIIKDNHTYSEIYELEDKFLIAAHPLKVVNGAVNTLDHPLKEEEKEQGNL